jgi:transcriptional regulator with XRE-family HTH domain
MSAIIAEQIRAGRELLGWSQEALAVAVNKRRATIAGFESGKRKPYARTVRQICVALEAAGVEFTHGGQPGVRMAQSNILMTATEFQTGIRDVKESCLLRRIPGLRIETVAASFARLTIDGREIGRASLSLASGLAYFRPVPDFGGVVSKGGGTQVLLNWIRQAIILAGVEFVA